MLDWWRSLTAKTKRGVQATIAGNVISGVILIPIGIIVAVGAGIILARVEPSTLKGSTTGHTPSPPYQRVPINSEPQPPPQRDFISLLGQPRRGAQVSSMTLDLGVNSERPLNPSGTEICFRQHGVHFVFDENDILDKVVFFAGNADDHVHPYPYTGKLPLDLRFDQVREEAGEQVDNSVHRHLEAELGTGEWDKFELEGYRLYLRFREFNGKQITKEIQIVRPEDHFVAR